MKTTKLLILICVISFNIAIAQEAKEIIAINPTNKAGLLDGSCGNDEWDAATKIELPGRAAIYLMHD